MVMSWFTLEIRNVGGWPLSTWSSTEQRRRRLAGHQLLWLCFLTVGTIWPHCLRLPAPGRPVSSQTLCCSCQEFYLISNNHTSDKPRWLQYCHCAEPGILFQKQGENWDSMARVFAFGESDHRFNERRVMLVITRPRLMSHFHSADGWPREGSLLRTHSFACLPAFLLSFLSSGEYSSFRLPGSWHV